MDNIDAQIDELQRDKLISLIQENQVRIGKYNIRYTRGNKKNTMEHWDKCLESYERLLKSIPKDLLKVEREVRTKFVADFPSQRETRLLSTLNTEIEVLIQKSENLYADEFRKFGAAEEFSSRIAKVRLKCQELMEAGLEKCRELSSGQSEESGRLPAGEICKRYEITESLLHELNLLTPLQDISIRAKQAEENSTLAEAIAQVQDGIRQMSRTLIDEGSGEMQSVKERKERKMQVARETLLFRDVVINILPLIDQCLLPPEQRNREVIDKLWDRIDGFFVNGRKDWEGEQTKFKSVYQAILDS